MMFDMGKCVGEFCNAVQARHADDGLIAVWLEGVCLGIDDDFETRWRADATFQVSTSRTVPPRSMHEIATFKRQTGESTRSEAKDAVNDYPYTSTATSHEEVPAWFVAAGEVGDEPTMTRTRLHGRVFDVPEPSLD